MAKQPRTQTELHLWRKEFEGVQQEWSEWYLNNKAQYKTIRDAWNAFKMQCQGQPNYFDLDSIFNSKHKRRRYSGG
jgi:hypothetical protein